MMEAMDDEGGEGVVGTLSMVAEVAEAAVDGDRVKCVNSVDGFTTLVAIS